MGYHGWDNDDMSSKECEYEDLKSEITKEVEAEVKGEVLDLIETLIDTIYNDYDDIDPAALALTFRELIITLGEDPKFYSKNWDMPKIERRRFSYIGV